MAFADYVFSKQTHLPQSFCSLNVGKFFEDSQNTINQILLLFFLEVLEQKTTDIWLNFALSNDSGNEGVKLHGLGLRL